MMLILMCPKAINVTTCLEGYVRLVNGQNQFEGRVEICQNGVWGTLCNDNWSTDDTAIVLQHPHHVHSNGCSCDSTAVECSLFQCN